MNPKYGGIECRLAHEENHYVLSFQNSSKKEANWSNGTSKKWVVVYFKKLPDFEEFEVFNSKKPYEIVGRGLYVLVPSDATMVGCKELEVL